MLFKIAAIAVIVSIMLGLAASSANDTGYQTARIWLSFLSALSGLTAIVSFAWGILAAV